MQNKFENPNTKHSEIADHLGYSSSTLQRYRNDINMLSRYTIQPNITKKRSKNVSNTTLDNNSHGKHELKKPQMTSNDLKTTSSDPVKDKKKNMRGGTNIEINDKILDELLHKKNL